MGQQSSTTLSKATGKTNGSEGDKGLEALEQGLVKDAGRLGGDLKNLAGDVAEEAKHAVEGKLDTQKGRVVDGLGDVAHVLRQVSRQGARGAQDREIAPALAPYIERAADQMDRASSYFENKTMGELARDVETFARREPALFLGGAFALGVLGGRFLKASQPSSGAGGNGSKSSGSRPSGGAASPSRPGGSRPSPLVTAQRTGQRDGEPSTGAASGASTSGSSTVGTKSQDDAKSSPQAAKADKPTSADNDKGRVEGSPERSNPAKKDA